jgi:hypothetical protein
MSRAAVLAVGGYDESLRGRHAEGCEDWKLVLLLSERHPFAFVPFSLTGYRLVSDSMSTNVDGMLRSHEIVLSELRTRHPGLPPSLFRESRRMMRSYLAFRAWHAGDFTSTTRMCAGAIVQDPRVVRTIVGRAAIMAWNRIGPVNPKPRDRMRLDEFNPFEENSSPYPAPKEMQPSGS